MRHTRKPVIILVVVIVTACYFSFPGSDTGKKDEMAFERFMTKIVEVRKINSSPGWKHLHSSGKSIESASRHKSSGYDAYIRSSRVYRSMNGDVARVDEFPYRRYRNISRYFDESRRNETDLLRAENTEWIKKSTREYSPDSWYLLTQYDTLPEAPTAQTIDGGIASSEKAAGTFYYLRGRSKMDLLASMETNVHEITHGYFDQNAFRYAKENNIKMNRNNAEGYIYLSPSSGYFISFPLKSMFPSHELNAAIPENMRTYRFGTYINGTTSTQSDGIIGLLNELDAYYVGSRFCLDMFEPYKNAAGSDAAGLFEWVTHTQSTMSAYYEFSFFINEYLLYMKKNYPSEYKDLVDYHPFGEALNDLKASYKSLIDRYNSIIQDEIKVLKSNGEADIKIYKGWLWIKTGNSNISSGTPMFSDLREKLQPVLAGRRYRFIAKDFPEKNN